MKEQKISLFLIIAKLCFLIFLMCFIIDFLSGIILIKNFYPLRVWNFKYLEGLSPILNTFFFICLIPIGYELLFRAPISLFSNYKKAFTYIFYGLAMVYGCTYIFNYELTTKILLMAPFIVIPKIILGLFLGLIRVRFGLFYSIVFHVLYATFLLLSLHIITIVVF